MPEYVRVTDKETGHQYSVTRERFDASPQLFRELKQDAARPDGTPLPPVYKTPDADQAPAKKAGSSANSEKE